MRAVVLFVVVLVGTGCAGQRNLNVYLTHITPMPSTLLEQRARLDLRLQNLSEQAINAQGLEVTLSVNGRRLARGVDGKSFTVPRLGETTHSVVVSASVFDTLAQLLALPDVNVFRYALKGRVVKPGPDQRFSQSGEIGRADLQPLVDQTPGP